MACVLPADAAACGCDPASAEFAPQCPGRVMTEALRRQLSASARHGTGRAAERPRRPAASRRSTGAVGGPAQVATLVIKNLAPDLRKEVLTQFLVDGGAAPAAVDFHLDPCGAFKGTAFVHYSAPAEAQAAAEALGGGPEIGGRRARVEMQKPKGLFGRRALEAELPQEELEAVREEIDRFLRDPSRLEAGLSPGFSPQQRKFAHSLAERHRLVHATRDGEEGEKYVYLSKARPRAPGEAALGRKKAHSAGGQELQQHAERLALLAGRKKANSVSLPLPRPAPGLSLEPGCASAAAMAAAARGLPWPLGGLPARPAPGLEVGGYPPAVCPSCGLGYGYCGCRGW